MSVWDVNKDILIQIKLDEKSCEVILIHYIGYVTVKDLKRVKNDIVNPLYLVGKMNGSGTYPGLFW